MHLLLLAVLATQVQVEVRTDTADRADRADTARHIEVTDAHRRTAFRTPAARVMLERARASRLRQDSAIMSYEATAYRRISAGMGFARIGRDRLLFRHENAILVRWHRDVGAWIEVKGARTHMPVGRDELLRENASIASDADLDRLPYYPGREPLLSFNGNGMVRTAVDERDIIHPLAAGAEAYYTYATGDSVIFRLPDGRSVRLRELVVRPRESRWNLAIGSLWFDAESGQLVRAAYRLATPLDIWAKVREEEPEDWEDVPVWVRPMISPMHGQITSIGVEYGMYQNRFWLPRLSVAEGHATVSFMRVPFSFEQSFRYNSVNALESLPKIPLEQPLRAPDSLSEAQRDAWRDSVRVARRQAVRDSIRDGLRGERLPCDSTGLRTVTRQMSSGIAMAVRIPCDHAVLANSPELPGSLYDDGEELFGSSDLDALKREALAMGVQPPLAIGRIPATLHYGLDLVRFNRIEGLSAGARVEQRLGAGYTATLLGRLGHADLQPNAELTISRSNLSRMIRVRGYHRLVAANDWGNPLSFGSSLSGLLFGRDEGFYYRATGAEVEWAREDRPTWSYRLFAEQQRPARVENEFSLGVPFIANIEAHRARYAGGAARFVHTRGLNPNGFRLFTDVRLEGATSDSAGASYGRAAGDFTFSQGIGRYAGAVTVSGGTSVGALPPQRRWYLGGAHTVRGQRADTAVSGDAYWLGRLELGGRLQAARPVIFGDVGWVGDRESWRDVGRPMSGAGVGVSILDGLLRFDLSRGVHPVTRVRLDMYVEARF